MGMHGTAADRPMHLDPDLEVDAIPRSSPDGFRGTLGQNGAAQTHLSNRGVGVGDLFLFFGLFRPVERKGAGWQWTGDQRHSVFGYLHVAEVLTPGSDGAAAARSHPWLAEHPHTGPDYQPNNAIYVASERLPDTLTDRPLPGWGVLRREHVLTRPGANTSEWSVPDWLHPDRGGDGMSYHPNPANWHAEGLTSAKRGQEFVADVGDRTDARVWVRDLLMACV